MPSLSVQLKIVFLFWCACSTYIIITFSPLWMVFTVSSTNPGMEGYFFYQYAGIYPTGVFLILMLSWMLRKASTSPAGSKVKNKSSSVEKDKVTQEENPQGSFSFTMDELNCPSSKPSTENA